MQNIEGGQPTKTWKKIVVGGISAFIMFLIVNSLFSGGSSAKNNSQGEFIEVVNQKDILVESTSIKKINNKYDYWFEIRNNSTSTLKNTVLYIALLDSSGKEATSRSFENKGEINPKMGDIVKINAYSIPYDAVHSFRYWIKEDGKVIKNGSGSLATAIK